MEKIRANIILEILGKPKEHVSEALTSLVLKIGTEKGVKILAKTIHPPIPLKESQTLFTTFAEVELEIDTMDAYLMVLFGYLPSHIEILSPEKATISNSLIAEIGNTLVSRLHNYDALAKNLLSDRDFLLQKIKELSPDLFKELTSPKDQVQTPTQKKKSSKKKKK